MEEQIPSNSVSSLNVDHLMRKKGAEIDLKNGNLDESSNSKGVDHDVSGATTHSDDDPSNVGEVSPEQDYNEQNAETASNSKPATTINANNSDTFELDIFSLVAKQRQQRAQKRLQVPRQQLLVLASLYGQASNREAFSQQSHTFTMLTGSLGSDFPFTIVDASDPENYPQRDALLKLSGIGPVYPQFFLAKSKGKSKDEAAKTLSDSSAAEGGDHNIDEGAVVIEKMEQLSPTQDNGLSEYEDIRFFGDYQDIFAANENETLRSSVHMNTSIAQIYSEDAVADDEQMMEEHQDSFGEVVGNQEYSPTLEIKDVDAESTMKLVKLDDDPVEAKTPVPEPEIMKSVSSPAKAEEDIAMNTTEDSVDVDILQPTATVEIIANTETLESFPSDGVIQEAKVEDEKTSEVTANIDIDDAIDQDAENIIASDTIVSDTGLPAESTAVEEEEQEIKQIKPTAVVLDDTIIASSGEPQPQPVELCDAEESDSNNGKSTEAISEEQDEAEANSNPTGSGKEEEEQTSKTKQKQKKKKSSLNDGRKMKKDPSVLSSLEIPEWVETWMLSPSNPVVRWTESIRQTVIKGKVTVTTEVTLCLRYGEQQTQTHTTIRDLVPHA